MTQKIPEGEGPKWSKGTRHATFPCQAAKGAHGGAGACRRKLTPQSLSWTFWEDHASLAIFAPPDRKGLLDFMLESAFTMLLHHAPTQYPARAARQWILPPERSPVDPAEYLAEYPKVARQWIPPSIPPE